MKVRSASSSTGVSTVSSSGRSMGAESGKGVPAALFMMVARVLIKAHLQNGESPAVALENVNNELFGNDRMLDALNVHPDAQPEEVLSNVMKGIDAFVAGAEQFDDITMLCLKYNGPAASGEQA